MNPISAFLRISLLGASLFLGAHSAVSAVFNIPNGDVAALKNAINAANANGQADTINLAAASTYTLTKVANAAKGANGLPVIKDDVAGLDLTINGNGATIRRSSDVATPEFRILFVGDKAQVACRGLTIANGKVSGANFPANAGAGIFVSGATLSLTDCVLREHTADTGGAMFNEAGTITLVRCTLAANGVETGGGAIYNTGIAALRRCIVNGNTSTSGFGGGVFNSKRLTIASSTFDGNKCATYGGAIISYPTIATVPATMKVLNSTLSNNTAQAGGGVSNSSAKLTLRNSTLSGNSAFEGGGLHNNGGKSTVQSDTFCANSAQKGGGIYVDAGGEVKLRSSILQTGATGANLETGTGAFTSEGSNVVNDAAGGDASTGPGGFLNRLGDIRNSNLNLGPLKKNGGPTRTHALIAPSAAIDAGDDSLLESPVKLVTDQRGVHFPRRRSVRVDSGAFESGFAAVVTTIDDHDDSACTAADCSLREAIKATNAAGSGDISFASGLSGIIQLKSALPNVSRNLVLQGPGAKQLTVRRNSGGNYRIFTISNGTSLGPEVRLSGVAISNGRAPAAAFPGDSGGGVLIDHAALGVSKCIISGNKSALPESSYGGGIFNHEGFLGVEESNISDNAATYGGGIACMRSEAGESYLYLGSNTLSANTAEGGYGGGLYHLVKNDGSFAGAFLTNNTFSGNSATAVGISGGAGGAIYHGASLSGLAEMELQDCTLSGNNAPSGGAIYHSNFSATTYFKLSDCILKKGAIGGNLINADGNFTSGGHNLSNDDAAGDTGTGPGGYLNGTGDIRNTDPQLGPLQNNGGPTPTHALLSNSPARDLGTAGDAPSIDQRGFVKRGLNDIGAFEFNGIEPRIISTKQSGDDIVVTYNGAVGFSYRLLRKLSPAAPTYAVVPGAENLKPSVDGPAQFTDRGAAKLGQPIYRIELIRN